MISSLFSSVRLVVYAEYKFGVDKFAKKIIVLVVSDYFLQLRCEWACVWMLVCVPLMYVHVAQHSYAFVCFLSFIHGLNILVVFGHKTDKKKQYTDHIVLE